jgi:protease PrsW
VIKMLAIATAPVLAFLIFVYQKDRYDREPSGLLLKLFVFGCLVTIPTYYTERFLSLFSTSPMFQAFVVAGLTEELFKFLIVKKLSFKVYCYNERLDGIIYSVFTSLGFATIENILYLQGIGANYIYTGLSRAIFAIPAHMLFAITMGYYLSLAKFGLNRNVFRKSIFKALVIPILLHGTYDYILFLRRYGLFPLFILFIIYLWRANLNRLNEYVRDSRER